MIGLDTNVVVRYIVQDDPTQSRQATRLIEACSAYDSGLRNSSVDGKSLHAPANLRLCWGESLKAS